jgi:hypothetical protein
VRLATALRRRSTGNDESDHKINDALQGLEQQADQEEIRLLPMTSVAAIGRHIVAGEIALPAPG